jgi:hypothetical protein
MNLPLVFALAIAAAQPASSPGTEPAAGLPGLVFGMDAERAVRLNDGDWVVIRYCTISDSGVEVYRMDATMTKRRWRTECKALGVPHSKYYHRADVDVKNNEAIVTSVANHGNGGRFEEKLDLATGKQTSRTQRLPGEKE